MDERRSREAWRVLRIQSELVDGIEHLSTLGPSVTIYGSARLGPDSIYYGQAKELARRFGDAGLNVLTGGGPGIMQGANEGAFGTDGCSIGLNIKLPHEQGANKYQDLSLDFRYFFVRKLMFVKHAVGFVVFPGGYGTMDELFEALTLVQTGKTRPFPIVLIGRDFWGGLVDWMQKVMSQEHGCIGDEDMALFEVTDSVEHAFNLVHENFHRIQEADQRDNLPPTV
ncbi:TIGR00730 family Rossman fold protein [Alcanivorax sp. 1008]|uniref:LOG family protein n=1 Tax=Alcanivorax sp. 1008 TaxID=2816853 RepID=UPI001D6CD416|nr:TIGR00730 family Rossman fold protein [Alcanivorax sp. 1008]MCC1497193.1 TIGR00730 family Rossman fold protein [Alcanivorax sp. 1008]MDF1629443.1 TIGR00730 family Rossman fold protein [Alcanivoracaceae bacterium]